MACDLREFAQARRDIGTPFALRKGYRRREAHGAALADLPFYPLGIRLAGRGNLNCWATNQARPRRAAPRARAMLAEDEPTTRAPQKEDAAGLLWGLFSMVNADPLLNVRM